MTRYTASHARAAAWVLVATLLFGWAVAGCDDTEAQQMRACAALCNNHAKSFEIVHRDYVGAVPVCICFGADAGAR